VQVKRIKHLIDTGRLGKITQIYIMYATYPLYLSFAHLMRANSVLLPLQLSGQLRHLHNTSSLANPQVQHTPSGGRVRQTPEHHTTGGLAAPSATIGRSALRSIQLLTAVCHFLPALGSEPPSPDTDAPQLHCALPNGGSDDCECDGCVHQRRQLGAGQSCPCLARLLQWCVGPFTGACCHV
jgi:hypothetical protein